MSNKEPTLSKAIEVLQWAIINHKPELFEIRIDSEHLSVVMNGRMYTWDDDEGFSPEEFLKSAIMFSRVDMEVVTLIDKSSKAPRGLYKAKNRPSALEWHSYMIPKEDWDKEQEECMKEKSPTHNIKAGDWTCHQGDEDLFGRLKQACLNAGMSGVEGLKYDTNFPLLYIFRGSEGLFVSDGFTIDEEFVNYRAPEYFLTAVNAQPVKKSTEEIELEKIADWMEGYGYITDTKAIRELYQGGFRVGMYERRESTNT